MFVLFDRVARPRCMIFYPAPGFRDAGDFNGTLFYVGRRGYGWSSTGAGTNAITCTSTTAFSPDRPTKRPVGARRILPSSRAGPNPLGENQSLSSPPLEPRGLLLSVMRQKVGKERSQGVFAPLAIPHRFLACPLRKFGPSPTPLRLCKTPVGVPSGTAEDGDSTSRDTAPPFSAQIFPLRTDATRRTGLLLENRDRRSRAPPPPPRGGRNFVAAPPATGPSPKKNLARRSLSARLGDSFYFAISKIVESLLRRGARGFSLHFATQTQQKPLWGRPQGFHLDFAYAKRLKSLFRRAGDRYRSATSENCAQAAQAAY